MKKLKVFTYKRTANMDERLDPEHSQPLSLSVEDDNEKKIAIEIHQNSDTPLESVNDDHSPDNHNDNQLHLDPESASIEVREPNNCGDVAPDNGGKFKGLKELSDDRVQEIIMNLLSQCDPKKRNHAGEVILPTGTLKRIALEYKCSISTISRYWKRAKHNKYHNPHVGDFVVTNRKKYNSGRRTKWDHEEVAQRIAALPQHLRISFRSISATLGIPNSTLHRLCTYNRFIIRKQKRERKREQVSMDPMGISFSEWNENGEDNSKAKLTDSIKLSRFMYASEEVRHVNSVLHYDPSYDTIHINEKFFFLTEKDYEDYVREFGLDCPEMDDNIKKAKRWTKKALQQSTQPVLEEQQQQESSLEAEKSPMTQNEEHHQASTTLLEDNSQGLIEVGEDREDEQTPHNEIPEKDGQEATAVNDVIYERNEKLPILKVMFICAVARPHYDHETGACIFDGKIGMWPFADTFVAKHWNPRRPQGTLETRTISVNYDAYFDCITQNVLPAIKQKFPRYHNDDNMIKLTIQHDSAPNHFVATEERWIEAVSDNIQDGWDFTLKERPLHSPDVSITDIDMFDTIQTLHWKQHKPALVHSLVTIPSLIDGMIESVMKAWDQYDSKSIHQSFVTHQACLDEIIACHGCNQYTIPPEYNIEHENDNNSRDEMEDEQQHEQKPLVLEVVRVSDKAQIVLQDMGLHELLI